MKSKKVEKRSNPFKPNDKRGLSLYVLAGLEKSILDPNHTRKEIDVETFPSWIKALSGVRKALENALGPIEIETKLSVILFDLKDGDGDSFKARDLDDLKDKLEEYNNDSRNYIIVTFEFSDEAGGIFEAKLRSNL